MKTHLRAFHGPTDWGWVKQQVNIIRAEDTCGIVIVDEEKNETVGAMILDNFTANSVQCHMMITTPMILKYGVLEDCFDYVFNVARKKVMYGWVPGDNMKALRLNRKMGWVEKARFPDAFKDGVDYVLMELTKANCRYLPKTTEEAA